MFRELLGTTPSPNYINTIYSWVTIAGNIDCFPGDLHIQAAWILTSFCCEDRAGFGGTERRASCPGRETLHVTQRCSLTGSCLNTPSFPAYVPRKLPGFILDSLICPHLSVHWYLIILLPRRCKGSWIAFRVKLDPFILLGFFFLKQFSFGFFLTSG